MSTSIALNAALFGIAMGTFPGVACAFKRVTTGQEHPDVISYMVSGALSGSMFGLLRGRSPTTVVLSLTAGGIIGGIWYIGLASSNKQYQ
jgi:xanthine/uracil/vitamin C permease (AzgA family)